MESAFGFEGACNQVVGRLAPEVRERPDALLDRAEVLLDDYGVAATTPRRDQISNRFLSDEIEQLGKFAVVMPAIFLAVAALVLSILMGRLAEQQRTTIGTLKAIGYSDGQVYRPPAEVRRRRGAGRRPGGLRARLPDGRGPDGAVPPVLRAAERWRTASSRRSTRSGWRSASPAPCSAWRGGPGRAPARAGRGDAAEAAGRRAGDLDRAARRGSGAARARLADGPAEPPAERPAEPRRRLRLGDGRRLARHGLAGRGGGRVRDRLPVPADPAERRRPDLPRRPGPRRPAARPGACRGSTTPSRR